jgi:hypothetical protein
MVRVRTLSSIPGRLAEDAPTPSRSRRRPALPRKRLRPASARRQKLTIVTNALNIASELAVRPGIKLITTGGVARSQSYELSGPIAEASLTGLNLNLAFIGVDGIDAQAGCTTHHEVEAHTNAVAFYGGNIPYRKTPKWGSQCP